METAEERLAKSLEDVVTLYGEVAGQRNFYKKVAERMEQSLRAYGCAECDRARCKACEGGDRWRYRNLVSEG